MRATPSDSASQKKPNAEVSSSFVEKYGILH